MYEIWISPSAELKFQLSDLAAASSPYLPEHVACLILTRKIASVTSLSNNIASIAILRLSQVLKTSSLYQGMCISSTGYSL